MASSHIQPKKQGNKKRAGRGVGQNLKKESKQYINQYIWS